MNNVNIVYVITLEEKEGIDNISWTGWRRTHTGNSRKGQNIKKSGVVGHLDLLGGRWPEEDFIYGTKICWSFTK